LGDNVLTNHDAVGAIVLYRLKNRGDETVIPEIVDTAATFLKGRGVRLDALVPVPPSNTARKRHQPVIALAKALATCSACHCARLA
jgi:hypothetical protein